MYKKEKREKTDAGRRIPAKWGLPVVILVVILVVVIVNFFSNSKKDASKAVQERFINQSDTCAQDISYALQLTSASAQAVAAVMNEEQVLTKGDYVRFAKALKNVQSHCYAVIITDSLGVGYSNDGVHLDISNRNYFSASDVQTCVITKNDMIQNRRACVVTTPYYRDGVASGNVYAFVSLEQLQEYLDSYKYINNAAIAICDAEGRLLIDMMGETAFFKNEQYAENLKEAAMMDMTAGRVLSGMENQNSFVFSAALDGEEKTIINVPLYFQDWQLVTVLDKSYIDTYISREWSAIRELTVYLGLIAVAVIMVIVVLIIINRIHYKQRSKELADKADTDLLTELNNKMATERKIQEYIDANPNSQCLFFLFDIDNFKKINDTLGHAFGDEVLRSLGQQLRNEFRVTDIIGRTGGDEFILFLKNLNSDEILEKEATRLVNLFHHFQAGEYVKYSATASIGATVYPRDAKDYQGLYKTADSALYEAKKRGKNRLVFYNDGLEEVTAEKKKSTPIESDMR